MLALYAITLTLASQSAASLVVPMSQEPYHRLVLKNEAVDVFDVAVPPRGTMRFHAHPTNHLAVVIRPGLLRNERLGGEAKLNPTGPAGTVVYIGAGPPHRQSNVGTTDAHFVAIELIPMKLRRTAQSPIGFAHEDRTETLKGTGCRVVVDKADARAWRCRLAPRQSVRQSRSAPFLRIPISGGALRTSSEPRAAQLLPGRPEWRKSSVRFRVTNVGSAPAEFVDVEIK